MNKINTTELTGAALDWAVAKCEGHELESLRGGAVWYWLKCSLTDAQEVVEVFKPSTDWAQGGPIIEREHITTDYAYWGEWEAWDDKTMPPIRYKGPTPLIAAMRCYVASKLGDTVDIPAELLTN